MTVHPTRVIVLVAVLVSISTACTESDQVQAQPTPSELYELPLDELRPLAEQGDVGAQTTLGLRYMIGDGVPQDDTEAVRWYRLAATQGHAAAQGNLGVMYATGQGVPRDDVEAHMWFNLAIAQSSGEDRERHVQGRGRVSERMTAEQFAEAQRRAREWTPTPEP